MLEVLGEGSPIQNFIDKNPKGGMHHICLEVNDINTAIDKLNTHEVSITGTGKPKIGAHGKPVVFLHPKSCNGTLIELEEVEFGYNWLNYHFFINLVVNFFHITPN